MNKSPYEILIRPLITEKALHGQVHTAPQYTFQVARDANKNEIRWAVEQAYGVSVTNVNTVVRKGKSKMYRTRGARPGRTATVKKAVVTLVPGQELQII